MASLLFADDVSSSDHDEAVVDCSLQLETECRPQAKEFKYLGILFTSEGKMEREIDGWSGAAAAVKQASL